MVFFFPSRGSTNPAMKGTKEEEQILSCKLRSVHLFALAKTESANHYSCRGSGGRGTLLQGSSNTHPYT